MPHGVRRRLDKSLKIQQYCIFINTIPLLVVMRITKLQ
ncbi:hypothetical protein ETAF_2036 [Edwardsiella tarda FL6-60]|uniref:Uncharacterized protein n=1 Tax=Edwardsiella tarda (strain FL6-60) TaxID=718251 RepID=A0A0H3DU40_EDWTF|nr:hypothetical protein ETAF_2036 [Edwardsiella tarda FL6-60]